MPQIKIDRSMMDKVLKGMKALEGTTVLVGIPQNSDGNVRREDDVPTNAEIGYVQEMGSPAQGIPPRPFLVPGSEAYFRQAREDCLHATLSAINGHDGQLDRDLATLGEEAAAAVKGEMAAGGHEPLAPATLEARRSRGNPDEDPLIDTGQLRDAITFEVER